MKKKAFLILSIILFVASTAFAQLAFIANFVDSKGAEVNGAWASIDLQQIEIKGRADIVQGVATIKLRIDTSKIFKDTLRLRVFNKDNTQLNIIPAEGEKIIIISRESKETSKDRLFLFYYDPGKSPRTQYLSAAGKVVASSKEALPFKLEITSSTEPPPAPIFSPAGGTYSGTQTVEIVCQEMGGTIRYTTDGSSPTSTYGTVFSGSVSVSNNTTLKALAYFPDGRQSEIARASYTIKVATPTISVPGGNYDAPQSVSMSCTTYGATIRYTVDGASPSTTIGTIYTEPITVDTETIIKAIAYKSGMSQSNMKSALYKFPFQIIINKTITGHGSVDFDNAISLPDGNVALFQSENFWSSCYYIDPEISLTPMGQWINDLIDINGVPGYIDAVCRSDGTIMYAFAPMKYEDRYNLLIGEGNVGVIMNYYARTINFKPLVVDVPDEVWQEYDDWDSLEQAVEGLRYEMTGDRDFCITKYFSCELLDNDMMLAAFRYSGKLITPYEFPSDLEAQIVIINEENRYPVVVHGPKTFATGNVTAITTAKLNNGNVLVAYNHSGGKLCIVNPQGDVIDGPKTFNSSGIANAEAVTLNNGNVLIAYKSGTGKLAIVDQTGNVIAPPKEFLSNPGNYNIVTIMLNNGNIFIACSSGYFAVVDNNGDTVYGPKRFSNQTVYPPVGALFGNGNILLAFSNYGTDYDRKVIVIKGE